MGLRPPPNTSRKVAQGTYHHSPGSDSALTKPLQHQRALEKAQRELDRERIKLEQQEKKLIADIKKSAKNGQMGACKIQAKDLVRTRRFATTAFPTEMYCVWMKGLF